MWYMSVTYAHVCTSVCANRDQRTNQELSSIAFHLLYYFSQDLSLNLFPLICSRDLLVIVPLVPNSEWSCRHEQVNRGFAWMLAFELRSSCLYSNVFYSLRHLLSNENTFYFLQFQVIGHRIKESIL